MRMGERGSNTDAGRANGDLDMLVRVYGKDLIYKQCIGKERGAVLRWDSVTQPCNMLQSKTWKSPRPTITE
jgi:hypothetical protein